jgi:nitrogenase subunit NifH
MAFQRPVDQFIRSPQPSLPESQIKYLQEELRKLERVIQTMYDALQELEARVTTVESGGPGPGPGGGGGGS